MRYLLVTGLVAEFAGDFDEEVDLPREGDGKRTAGAASELEERVGSAHSVEGEVVLTLPHPPAVERVDEDPQIRAGVPIGIGHEGDRVVQVGHVLDVHEFERLGSRLEDVDSTAILSRDAQSIAGNERPDGAQAHAADPGVGGGERGLTFLKGEESGAADGGDAEGADRCAGFPAAVAASSIAATASRAGRAAVAA